MAKKENRIVVTMACNECKNRNYTTEKNRQNDTGRIELKKFCRHCRKHTVHREAK
jgi:large subunit ribosomal protein L33